MRNRRAEVWRRPADWAVRWKVVAALAIPIAAALAISGVRLADLLESAGGFSRDASLSRAQEASAGLVREAGKEQVAVAVGLTRLAEGAVPAALAIPGLGDQQGATTAALQETLDTAAPFAAESEEIRTRVRSVQGAVTRIEGVRGQIAEALGADVSLAGQDVAELVRAYSDLSGAALRLGDAMAAELVDDSVQRQGETAQSLSEMYRQDSLQDALVLVVLGAPAPADGPLRVTVGELVASEAARVNALSGFDGSAGSRLRAQLGELVTASDSGRARSRNFQLVLTSLGGGPVVTAPPASIEWATGAVAVAENLDRVRADVSAAQVDRATQLQNDQLRRATIEAIVVLAALILSLFVTVALGSLIVRPLSTLRREAMETAEQHLPAAIARLREEGAQAHISVRPISVGTREEVGQAARAFDAVSERAVRLAMEQEALRAGLNDVLVNLSRRSQGLVERQLQLIDQLERDEENPEQLAQLFRLDHLASRMRRYNDNLLILAGETRLRRIAEPMTLIDVLRAAASEIEQYARVRVRSAPDMAVLANAAPALVHLVAELLDNATSYSDPQHEVHVSVHGQPGEELIVAIIDSGIGLASERLTEANDKLASALLADPVTDKDARRQMGLYVVAQLARNHGIRVSLRARASGQGTMAEVVVPTEILALSEQDGGRSPTATAQAEVVDAPAGRGSPPAPAVSPQPREPLLPAALVGVTPPPPAPPLPVPLTAGSSTHEDTPLYDALSAWFRPNLLPSERPPTVAAIPTPPVSKTFASPADQGWAAVAAATTTSGHGEMTAAGLPLRRPQTQLLPGGITTIGGRTSAPVGTPVARPLADTVRSRLNRLQTGVRAGRSGTVLSPSDTAANGGRGDGQADSEVPRESDGEGVSVLPEPSVGRHG